MNQHWYGGSLSLDTSLLFWAKGEGGMRSMKRVSMLVSVAVILCFSMFLGGCAKTVAVETPPAQTGIAQDQTGKILDLVNRAEAAAARAEQAAGRSEAAADRSEAAAQAAAQSAMKAEAMADKAETIFMQRMRK
jgi:uncharacterized protein YycO